MTEPTHPQATMLITGATGTVGGALARVLAARGIAIRAMVRSRGTRLGAGMPAWQSEGLIEDAAHYARGEAAVITTGVQDVTGHALRGVRPRPRRLVA